MSRIYIGRLSRDAQVEDVEKLCAKFGEIKEVNLKNGFGFVEYYSNRNAEDATDELNSTEFFGEKIIVELAKGLARRRDDRRSDRRDDYRRSERESRSSRRAYQHGGYRLIVDNLHSSISWQDLKDYMRKAGHVTFADAHKTRVGEGVVEFSNKDDMRYALETLDGTELKGHKIYLTEVKNPLDIIVEVLEAEVEVQDEKVEVGVEAKVDHPEGEDIPGHVADRLVVEAIHRIAGVFLLINYLVVQQREEAIVNRQ
ncbi:hypothetical protein HDU92_002812 [Lobulomyces angularis]|nr:hypothetical protein HDU92_002812 [Lobulomyces angularis]